MGYYTHYEISVNTYNKQNGGKISPVTDQEILSRVEGKLQELNIDNLGAEGSAFYADDKWYDSDEDIARLSVDFHDILFVVEGDGENLRDIWRSYIMNGKIQRCVARITFDEFDEDKMRPANC